MTTEENPCPGCCPECTPLEHDRLCVSLVGEEHFHAVPGLRVHPEFGEPGGPPSPNPGWYRGNGGQWRLEPVRKPEFMREGIHAIVGALNAGVLIAGEPVGAAIIFVGFLAYEITEGLRINDWAYRDIGGHLMGFTGVTVAWATWKVIERVLS